jgi:membrane dipeptidase
MFAMFAPTPNWEFRQEYRVQGPKGPKKSKGWDVPMAGRVTHQGALNAILTMMGTLLKVEKMSKGRLKVVRNHKQLTNAMGKGAVAAVMHIEGAEALKKDLDALGVLYETGLRSLGPVWSRPNAFGYGVPFNFPDTPDIGPGLTPAGKNLVRLCNELGIVVDLSHLNEKGFWDVAAMTDAPLVVSHAGVHALSPSPRNLTDDQIQAVGESGGIVGVNFARAFLRKDGRGDKKTSLTEIVTHVEYLAEKMGEDHVGLGSDFDGTKVPQDLEDVAGLPKLMAAFRERGIKGKTLKKIAHGNWLRVLKKTWKK